MKIDELAAAISLGRVRVTNRADEELHANGWRMDDVCARAAAGTLREDLPPEGAPYPTCRVAGRTADGEPFESVWAWNPRTGWAALINAYRAEAPPEGGEE
jgi:hypothetical protein